MYYSTCSTLGREGLTEGRRDRERVGEGGRKGREREGGRGGRGGKEGEGGREERRDEE